ncbi:MAG: WD40 repeat domain-containing protein [Proteobacteria bacterium]|nr:MAG: WD40 repeat domain-containing protein [Pseudomonadota bacterium]
MIVKKALLLLLAVPLIVGALYLCPRASWYPKKVFYGRGEIRHLVFSDDGKTLLVSQVNTRAAFGAMELTALNFAPEFTTKWNFNDGAEVGKPQFFLHDSRILVDRGTLRTLDGATGEALQNGGTLRKAAISPDGKWLAYSGAYPSDMGCLMPATISHKDIFLESPTGPTGAVLKTIPPGQSIPIGFSFSPNSRNLVVARIQREGIGLDFYDVKTWKRDRRLLDFRGQGPGSMQWSRNGRFLLSTCYFHDSQGAQANVNLWSVSDAKRLSSLIVPCVKETGPFYISDRIIVPYFEVQDDGRVLRFGIDEQVLLSKTTNLEAGFESLLSLPSERITAATLSPDDSYLVAGTKSGRVVSKRMK